MHQSVRLVEFTKKGIKFSNSINNSLTLFLGFPSSTAFNTGFSQSNCLVELDSRQSLS